MIPRRTLLPLVVLAAICWATLLNAQQIAIYFSPTGGCTAAAVAALDTANTSADVMTYQLTSPPLIAALARAAQRGCTVRILLDRTQESAPASRLEVLPRAGATLKTDPQERIQHNKVAVIDSRSVITGSFNWSTNAELNNAENLLIITDQATAALYAQNFQAHWDHSRQWLPKPRPIEPPKKRPPQFHPSQPRPQH
jgi:phosphatidylserine/phosphatidylglycerophosphate/cardiolipin synthase-like enzyme